MAEEALNSIIQYNDDIDTAEAPEPLPNGAYPFEIEKAERKTSQNTGNEYVAVTVRIATADFPATYDINNAPEGVVLTYGRLSPADNVKARWQMRKFREAIGAPGGRELNLNDWIGLRGMAELVTEDYEGVPQNRIKSVRAS